jgi:hypothetical protein
MKTENQDIELLDGEISLDNLDAMFSEASTEETTLVEEITKDLNEEPKPTAEEVEEEEEETDSKPTNTEKEEEEGIIIDTKPEDIIVSKDSNILSRAKSLIDLGIIEDVRVSINSEDEEGTLLSEFKDLSEDQLKKIIDKQQEKKNQEIEDKFISKDGISEDNLRIINILKEGGDITEIFSSAQQMQRPFEGLDLHDEKTQKQIILHHYIHNAGNSQKEALVLLKQKEEDFEVDSYSKQIVDAYDKKYDEFLTSKETEIKEKAAEKRERVAEVRKNLSQTLKDNKIKDSISRKIIDGVTKPTSEKNRFQVHEALDKILENPQENHEILLHLLDPKSFIELYKVKQKSKEIGNTIMLLDALPKDKAKKLEKSKKEDTLTEFEKEITNISID